MRRNIPSVFTQGTPHRKTSLRQLAGIPESLPLLPSTSKLGLVNVEVEQALLGVDGDGVAILDETDGTTDRGLGHDVTDQEAVRAAGEAAVGDESAGGAEAGAHECGGGLEHLGHAGSALGAGVADDNDGLFLLFDLVALESGDEIVLVVEDAGLADEAGAFLAGDLADGAAGGQGAAEDLNVAGLLDGVGQRPDDLLVGWEVGNLLEVLGKGLTRDGHAGAVDDALLEQELEQGGGAADVVQVSHDVLARWLQVGQERGAVRDLLEVLDVELDANRVGDGDQVEDGIGRATGDVDDDHGVLEGLASQDVRRPNVLLEQPLDGLTGRQAFEVLGLGLGRVRRGAGQRHTHDLDGGRHGVGRVHTATGTTAGAGVADDVKALVLGDLAGQELSVRLEGRNDIDVCVVLSPGAAGLDGTAVHHQTGAVDTTHGHQHTGHVLVATGDTDVRVVPLATHDGFDGIGDQITALQRVSHSLGTHTDGVADTNGVELEADQTGLLHTFTHPVAEIQQVHVTGVAVVPDRRNTDLRLVHILLCEACSVQHSLGSTLRDGLCDIAGDLIQSRFFAIFASGESSRKGTAGLKCIVNGDPS